MITVGIGLRAQASWPALVALLAQCGLGPSVLLAMPERLENHALMPQIRALGHPLSLIAQCRLHGVQTLTRSPRILRLFGTGSLAEACALTAAGPRARLTGPRLISPDRCITLALAHIGDEP